MDYFKLFAIFAVAIVELWAAGTDYNACPNNSVCVDPEYCNETNIVYDAMLRSKDEKFMCGIIEGGIGYVCCSEPTDTASSFPPSPLLWFFPFDAIYEYIAPISPTPDYDKIKEENSYCPDEAVCVPTHMCNNTDESEVMNYTKCGLSEMEGWVCCADEFTEAHLSTSLGFLENLLSELYQSDVNETTEEESSTTMRRRRSTGPVITIARPPRVLLKKKEKVLPKIGRSVSQDATWECGVTLEYSRQLTRIYAPVGDHNAYEGDFPWHVAITDLKNTYLCSGVIVGEKVVLTVAHCVFKETAGSLLVRIGDVDLEKSSEKYESKDATVTSLVIHPDFDDHYLENNIAVLKLEESLKGLPNIRPACLPDRFTPNIVKCKVPGWGQYVQSKEEINDFSYQLRSANFHIIPRRECRDSLRKVPKIGSFFKLQKSVICARGYTSADTCKGDGGGGLVCLSDSIYVLKGLVSWGAGCGQNLPGVYTDVSQFIDFIKNFEADEYISRKPLHQQTTQEYKDPIVLYPTEERSDIYETSDDTYQHDSNVYIPPSRSDTYQDTVQDSVYDFSLNKPYYQTPPKDTYIDERPTEENYYNKDYYEEESSTENVKYGNNVYHNEQPVAPDYYEPLSNENYNEQNGKDYYKPSKDYYELSKENYYEEVPTNGVYYEDLPPHNQDDLNYQENYDKLSTDNNRFEDVTYQDYYEELPTYLYDESAPKDYYEASAPKDYYEESSPKDYYDESAPKDYYEESPSKDYYEESPPKDYYEESPSKDYYEESPPKDYYEESTPKDYYEEAPPKDYEESPPKDYYEESPPKDYYEESPPNDYYGESPPNDYYGESEPIDYYKESAPKDYYEESAPKDYYEESAPKDYYEESAPKDYYEESLPHEYYDEAQPDYYESSAKQDYNEKLPLVSEHPKRTADYYEESGYENDQNVEDVYTNFPTIYRPEIVNEKIYKNAQVRSEKMREKLKPQDKTPYQGSKLFPKQGAVKGIGVLPYFMFRNKPSTLKKDNPSPISELGK